MHKQGSKVLALDNYYAKIFTFSSVDFIQVASKLLVCKGTRPSQQNETQFDDFFAYQPFVFLLLLFLLLRLL